MICEMKVSLPQQNFFHMAGVELPIRHRPPLFLTDIDDAPLECAVFPSLCMVVHRRFEPAHNRDFRLRSASLSIPSSQEKHRRFVHGHSRRIVSTP